MIVFFYSLLLIFFSVYSYALIDPNLTLIQSPIWVSFRNSLVDLGYYHRDVSWLLYLAGVLLLFIFSYLFLKKYRQVDPFRLSIIIGAIMLFSYPFLSHDFFNYMFDAKIVTWYQQNPYFFRALDFPNDQWLRFMHWTHRTYPYGPLFLLMTLIPSFLSFGKFLLSFLLFKAMFVGFYLLSVYCLQKLNKKWALIFATSPLILVEGLVNGHNDLIGVSLALVGIYFLLKGQELKSRLFLVSSAGIKYITLPLIFLSKKHKRFHYLAIAGLVAVLIYLSFRGGIQPWYFLNIFVLVPFSEKYVTKMNIFFLGLLVSYYPYIRLGGWDTIDNVNLKHSIIMVFFIIGSVVFLYQEVRKKYV